MGSLMVSPPNATLPTHLHTPDQILVLTVVVVRGSGQGRGQAEDSGAEGPGAAESKTGC